MWKPDARATRSSPEARAVALRVAREASVHPENFAELARRYSDDTITRSNGGSLGGVRATQLPAEFLDALTALSPGEVSRIIVGKQGFHILLRKAAPPPQSVSGRRVVIRYEGTLGSADEGTAIRSREEARRLAEEVARRARETPFASLIQQYSEHGDRAFGGDMGVWSTVDPQTRPREVESLSRLGIGEIGAPLDSLFGFQVIQRIDPSPPRRYSMAAIRLKVDPHAPATDPLSEPNVYAEARSVESRLCEAPASFAELQRRYKSEGVETWDFGHGSPELTLALDKLRFGEIAKEPVRVPFFIVIPMRLDPALISTVEPSPTYELPTRAAPDLERLFHDSEAAGLSEHLSAFQRPEVLAALRLTTSERTTVNAVFDTLRKKLVVSKEPAERVQNYRDARQRLHDALSEASYGRLMSFVESEAVRVVLAYR
jgi:hypothetical protein